MSAEEIRKLNLPTGIPFVYELDENLKPVVSLKFLEDEEKVRKAMEAIASQIDHYANHYNDYHYNNKMIARSWRDYRRYNINNINNNNNNNSSRNDENARKKYVYIRGSYRFIISVISWVFFFQLVTILFIVSFTLLYKNQICVRKGLLRERLTFSRIL